MPSLYLHALWLIGFAQSLAFPSMNEKRQSYAPSNSSLSARCSADTFQSLNFPGIEILNIKSESLLDQTIAVPDIPGIEQILGDNLPPPIVASFCNVTITYTHPGWNDTINLGTLLPSQWNGRFLANGGGGFTTGNVAQLPLNMLLQGTSEYALSVTDGGHYGDPSITDPWPLTSPGNVNWPLLLDFSSVALHDMAVLGKAVTEAYYRTPPKYSYFFGGSTGGRQGHMLAQRYPEDFDGIVGNYPAVYWDRLMASLAWPTFIMDQLKYYPPSCELTGITNAAIEACDELDGVKDGIISCPELCTFEAASMVGKSVPCGLLNSTKIVTSEGAQVMQAVWDGPKNSDGEQQWYGYGHGAMVAGPTGIASTTCDLTNTVCEAAPFSIPFDWATWFVAKDPAYVFRNVSHEEWDAVTHQTLVEYASIIETDDIDLTELKKSGTKLLTWHGTVDPLIPYNSTSHYYDQVLAKQPDVQDYYRYYIAPGAGHSPFGGIAPTDSSVLKQMQDWVEHGIAPDVLHAQGTVDGKETKRDLCLYPKVQHYAGGDSSKPESFICV